MAEEPLPRFPLFPTAFESNVFEQSTEACECCERSRGWVYSGNMYGTDDNERAIGPWCIADGSAAERFGLVFTDSTQFPYNDRTPQLPSAERDLIEKRTPGFVTWQGDHWLGCCNRACIYLGEAKHGDLQGRWAEAVPSLFGDDEFSADEMSEIVDRIGNGGTCAYIFQCQVCKRLKGYWDCD